MRFCQTDGTELVDDAPAFDPYATMVARPEDLRAPAKPEPLAAEPSPVHESAKEVPVDQPAGESVVLEPILTESAAESAEVLDLPEQSDPLKTMYVSDTEMQAALGEIKQESKREEVLPPEPPSFSVPEIPAPSFGDPVPPPSPFSTPGAGSKGTDAEEPFDEAKTIMQPSFSKPAVDPDPPPVVDWKPSTPAPPAAAEWTPPAPVAEWTPAPVGDTSKQNKEIGSSALLEAQPAVAGKESKGLALGSLICGILSFTLCSFLGLFLGPVALVMGFIAKKKADEDPSQFGGRGLALGGMVTGILGLLAGIGIVGFLLLFGSWGSLLK